MISTIAQPLSPPAKPDSVLLWIKRVVFSMVFALLIVLLFIFTALAADRVIAKSNIPSVFGFFASDRFDGQYGTRNIPRGYGGNSPPE